MPISDDFWRGYWFLCSGRNKKTSKQALFHVAKSKKRMGPVGRAIQLNEEVWASPSLPVKSFEVEIFQIRGHFRVPWNIFIQFQNNFQNRIVIIIRGVPAFFARPKWIPYQISTKYWQRFEFCDFRTDFSFRFLNFHLPIFLNFLDQNLNYN